MSTTASVGLPDGWSQEYDSEREMHFFWDSSKGESQWEHPVSGCLYSKDEVYVEGDGWGDLGDVGDVEESPSEPEVPPSLSVNGRHHAPFAMDMGDLMIENWYRDRGLLSGNKRMRWTGEDRYTEKMEIVDTDKSAEKIQKIWRGFLDRRYVEDLRAVNAAGIRVYWTSDGEMMVIDLNDAAIKIQRIFRGWSVRSKEQKKEKVRSAISSGQVAHGFARGGKVNPLGSFWVSKKKGTVLASGFVFQKGGDQRWAVGMKAENYCPCHTKIDVGTQYLCMCQCPSTLVARANHFSTTEACSEVAENITRLIFT